MNDTVDLDKRAERFAWFAVWVAALGYFVDVFDMWLFANFRVASLTDLGLSPEEVTALGAFLINWQQFGFLLGGFAWGILGDRRGRASVMFASIILYSVANLLNAFVWTVEQYAVLRFITGFGLAGEIGAGITLIAELLPKAKRGYGTTIVTGLGVSGAVFAALAGKYLVWRHAYIVGGVMGLLLLLLRYLVHESGMYGKMKEQSDVRCGSLKMLFSSPGRVVRFLSCIFLGVPIYLCYGIVVSFSPEIGKAIGIAEPVRVPDVMFYTAIGLTFGDILAGLLSQYLKSRKKPIAIFAALSFACALFISAGFVKTAHEYQIAAGLMGIFVGYWACIITTTAEQFGTNLRATVTTSVPNLIRATTIILTTVFISLKDRFDVSVALVALTIGVYALTFLALALLKESFHSDLDFYEE